VSLPEPLPISVLGTTPLRRRAKAPTAFAHAVVRRRRGAGEHAASDTPPSAFDKAHPGDHITVEIVREHPTKRRSSSRWVPITHRPSSSPGVAARSSSTSTAARCAAWSSRRWRKKFLTASLGQLHPQGAALVRAGRGDRAGLPLLQQVAAREHRDRDVPNDVLRPSRRYHPIPQKV